ncbi:MAG: type II toxin-antitoxin system YafQ family toxin [Kiritimatiellae bacterium]|nr:type II toxin-antitoxin system YafQ family toxin [Kiritimatiellia bacterium]
MSHKYHVNWTSQFKKDYKLAQRRHLDIAKLDDIIGKLADSETLPPANKDHPLSGNWANHRECHIAPDWLLIYQIKNDVLVLTLTRTGTHADLF